MVGHVILIAVVGHVEVVWRRRQREVDRLIINELQMRGVGVIDGDQFVSEIGLHTSIRFKCRTIVVPWRLDLPRLWSTVSRRSFWSGDHSSGKPKIRRAIVRIPSSTQSR